MSGVLSAVVLIVLILALALVLSLGATLGVVAVGWVVTQVFADLSLFQASLLALVISATFALVAYRVITAATRDLPYVVDEDWEEEEEEEEPEPPIVPWRRGKLTDQPPAQPSGKPKGKKRR
jgi:hypothetical protein